MRTGAFERVALAAWALLALAAAGLAAGLIPAGAPDALTLCPVRLLSGWRCPGCGMGHALLDSFQGRFAEAFAHHPLGPALFLLWSAWLSWGLRNRARGRPFSAGVPALGGRAAAGLLILVLAVHAARAAAL